MKLPQYPTHIFASSLCSLGCTPHADAQREPSQVGVVGLLPACGPGQKGGGGSPLLALCVTGALRQFMVISLLLKQVQQHEDEDVITLIHPGGVVEWHPSSCCMGSGLRSYTWPGAGRWRTRRGSTSSCPTAGNAGPKLQVWFAFLNSV